MIETLSHVPLPFWIFIGFVVVVIFWGVYSDERENHAAQAWKRRLRKDYLDMLTRDRKAAEKKEAAVLKQNNCSCGSALAVYPDRIAQCYSCGGRYDLRPKVKAPHCPDQK